MYESSSFDYTTANVSRLNYIENIYKNNIKKLMVTCLAILQVQNYLLFRICVLTAVT